MKAPRFMVGDRVVAKDVAVEDDRFDVGTVVGGSGDNVRVWWALADAKYDEHASNLRHATLDEQQCIANIEREQRGDESEAQS